MTDATSSKPRRGRPPKARPANAPAILRLERAGLHEQAAERLRGMIVAGELPPGAALVEVDLSEALGISRTPVREAIKLLAQSGLVELRANRSPRVRPLHPDEIHDLFEALAGVERIAAELAALRMRDADLQRLRDLQTEIEAHHAAGDRSAYSASNRAIHEAIVAGSGNASLQAVHATLLSRAELVRFFALRIDARWEQSVAEHAAILDALLARDPARAGALLGAHTGQTSAIVEARLDALSPASTAA